LKHWWVPVPKGLWYKYNGIDLRIPDNGLLDIMTGRFETSYKMYEGPLNAYTDDFGSAHSYTPYADGANYIFKRNQLPIIGEHFDYFESWDYITQDVDYIIQTTVETPTFIQPDLYSIGVRSLASGLVLPISKATSDVNNRVIGEWYYSGD
jgi:hypothetical protein